MFAHILFEFAGEHAQRQYFTFELPEDIGVLKKGEILVVEGINPGETRLGIFVRAFPIDHEAIKYPEKYPFRKKVIKKAHKNSLINLVKRRYEIVKDLRVPNTIYKKYKKEFQNNADKDKDEVRKSLMRNIIIAAEKHRKKPKLTKVFVFGNMKIILEANVVRDLIRLEPKKIDWIRPRELEKIAVDYIDKM